ncbi:MAG: hypothetical protein AAB967_03255, partial [Patescibacteria group bacterium]
RKALMPSVFHFFSFPYTLKHMESRERLVQNLFLSIRPALHDLPARWEAETRSRAHLISLNTQILNFFNRDLSAILDWGRSLGFQGFEVRPQDLFGFTGTVDSSRVRALQESGMVFGFHLSDWTYWVDAWRGDISALLQRFGSEKVIRQYFGGMGRDTLLRRWREEIALAEELGALYIVFHAHEIDLDSFFTNTFYRSHEETLDAVSEVIREFRIPVLLENGNTFSRGACALTDFSRFTDVDFVIDTSHLESIVLENVLPTKEDFEAAFYAELSRFPFSGRVRAVHLSDTRFCNQHIPVPPHHTSRNFTDKRKFVNGDEKFFDHLPVGATISSVRQTLDVLRPTFVSHELKLRDRATLEQAYAIQKHFITRDS